MAEEIERDKCPHCYSDVDPRATVCPHCQRNIVRREPLTPTTRGILLAMIAGVALLCMIAFASLSRDDRDSGRRGSRFSSEPICIGHSFFDRGGDVLGDFRVAYGNNDIAGMDAAIARGRALTPPPCGRDVKTYLLRAMEAGRRGDSDAMLGAMVLFNAELEAILEAGE